MPKAHQIRPLRSALLAITLLALPTLAAAQAHDPACGALDALAAEFMPEPDARTVLTGVADMSSALASGETELPPEWLDGDWEPDTPPTGLRAAFIEARFEGDVVTTCPGFAARLGALGVRFGDDEADKARAEAPKRTVVYAFSLPVLSADSHEALAYAQYLCGVRTCGAGFYFYPRRSEAGPWTVAGGKLMWIS
jgi:hypothetical protein